MPKKLINFTGRDIEFHLDNGGIRRLPRRGSGVNIYSEKIPVQPLSIDEYDIPVFEIGPDEDVYPPEQQEGVIFIVTRPVAEHRPERTDLYFPYRYYIDNERHIIVCRALGRLSP